ncbi:WD40 repeat domain-containing protein [Catellatospora citrea]|uniref:WD40 repeat protein n=1 Tax=Catellatospora citrea TaxID=53366 RepID=A0A8J3K5T9_9ACTN|nr:WD40 repeat domain-containing protein [Catellatospora citrea]GIF97007.1 hypothetical protein Cci01nite_21010 [Catellatospora citrea]
MNDLSAGELDLLDASHRDVLAALGSDTTPQGRTLLSAWRAARRSTADGPGNLWQAALMVELLRRGENVAARQLGTRRPASWLPSWAAGPPLNLGLQHIYQLDHLIAATTVVSVDGRQVGLCFDQDGVVHTIDMLEGTVQARQMSDGEQDYYRDATFADLDGQQIIAAVTEQQALVWATATGDLLTATDPDDIPRPAGHLTSVAVGHVAGTGVALAGTREGYLLLWSIPDGQRIAKFNDGHSCYVSSIAISPDGPPIAVTGSGGEAATVCFWDLATRQQIGQPRPTANISQVGWTRLADQPHAVTIDERGLLQLWLPHQPEPVASHPTGVVSVGGLACTVVEERPVAVLSSGGRVRLLDLLTGLPTGDTMTDFTQDAEQVAVSPPNTSTRSIIAVQGWSTEGRVNILDLRPAPTGAAPAADGDVSSGSKAPVYLDADIVTVAGRQVIAVIGDDATLRLHDVSDGQQSGPPLTVSAMRTPYGVRLRCLTLGNRPVGISATPGPFTAVYLDDGSHLPLPDQGPQRAALAGLACDASGPTKIVVLSDQWGSMITWDLQTMRMLGHRPSKKPRSNACLAVTAVEGRTTILSASRKGKLRRWETDLTAHSAPIAAHNGPITAINTLDIDGRPTAVTVGDDGLTSSWDLQSGKRHGPKLRHPAPVNALLATTFGGIPATITACKDRTLRIWNLLDGKILDTIPTPRPVKRIFATADNNLVLLDPEGLTCLGNSQSA